MPQRNQNKKLEHIPAHLTAVQSCPLAFTPPLTQYMAKIAILSDIHANLPAFKNVLRDGITQPKNE